MPGCGRDAGVHIRIVVTALAVVLVSAGCTTPGNVPGRADVEAGAVQGSCSAVWREMQAIRATGIVERLHKQNIQQRPSKKELQTYERFLRLNDAYEHRCRSS